MSRKHDATARRRKEPAALAAAALLLALPLSAPALAAASDGEEDDLSSLSLEELLDIEVTIASRSKQKLSDVPAAVYVITGEEIRRSGHSSLPEVLRMVPGFYVSHWTTGAWDVTSRGFGPGTSITNGAYLNQLLVLIDGVVVYSPLFAGTWWPLQDLDLGDVDRIEIVRGPGGILWGSNAVHGVVHIITKRSDETQGVKLYARGATDDDHASARYGGKIGETGTYRAYVKWADYDTLDNPFLGFSQDWNLNSGGLRADWAASDKQFTVWSRGYFGDFDGIGFDPTPMTEIGATADKQGFQLFGSMFDPEADSTWQAWISTDRQDIPTVVDQAIDQFDFEYHREVDAAASRLLFGGGYRMIHSDLEGLDPTFMTFDPETQTNNIFRLFAVDTLDVTDEVEVVAGVTLEHNTFTEWEVQPTLRASWRPTERFMTWASVSRAVRTPSLEEESLAPGSVVAGSTGFLPEVLWAYELGARAMVSQSVWTDLALFVNDYDHLHNVGTDPSTLQPTFDNEAEGSALGGELAVDVQATESWKIRSAFTLINGDYEVDGVDTGTEDQHPEQQLNVRSYLDLPYDLELDAAIYVVDDLGGAQEIAEYTRIDVRLGWKPSDELELFCGCQNLNQDTHSEFDEFDNTRRSVFFGVDWRP
jgi:iron complex outermembrane receptor protein